MSRVAFDVEGQDQRQAPGYRLQATGSFPPLTV
jgi:hypothetical protein